MSELQPYAEIEYADGNHVVHTYWPNVDRPSTHAISAGKNARLAARLQRAINLGLVYHSPKIVRDIHGKTFVSASCRVIGRRLNADLKRLGA